MAGKNIQYKLIVAGGILLIATLALFMILNISKQPLREDISVGDDKDGHSCIGSAGYSWCDGKDKCLRIFEEFCPDNVYKLVREIQNESGVILTYQGETRFNWIINAGNDRLTDRMIEGVKYEADDIGYDEYAGTENYLDSVAETDIYNSADGDTSGSKGYRSNYMACLLGFSRSDMEQSDDTFPGNEEGRVIITLECGFYNPNMIDDILLGEGISGLFVGKYGLAPESIRIVINQKTDQHIRGDVIFLDERSEPASGGYFFARKTGNDWHLVLDGNGQIDCSVLRENGFPVEMMFDCTEDDSREAGSSDIITVDSPRPEEGVSSPVAIKGQARGYWFFEASFPVRIYDGNGFLLGAMPVRSLGEWMTEDYVGFDSSLYFSAPSIRQGRLVLEKDNPSGLPENDDRLVIPVNFRELPEETGELMTVRIFLSDANYIDAPDFDCSRTFMTEREVLKSGAVGRSSVEALLRGPTPAEGNNKYISNINPGTRLKALTIDKGIAYADFDERLGYQVGGSCRVSAIRAQIEDTLKQFSTVDQVIISIEGRTEGVLEP